MSDKTEEPTPKRLRKALEEGDSPQSSFASQAVAFMCAVAAAPAAVTALTIQASADMKAAIAHAADASPTIAFDAGVLASTVVALTAPILLAAGVSGAVVSVVQTGGAIATKRIGLKLERLDPIAGFRQLFGATKLVAIARAAIFAGAVTWIVACAARAHAADIVRTVGRLDGAARIAGLLAREVVTRAAIIGLFLGVLDVVVTRRSWRKKLMMSKDEVKREHKESEGDPHTKAARERAHHEMLAAVAIGNVKKATVVVVNPTHIACALRYEDGRDDDSSDGDREQDEAPVLVAAGEGELAAKIVEAARQYGIPVLRDVPLARALVELEIGSAIPEALYEAVAEILREAWEEEA